MKMQILVFILCIMCLSQIVHAKKGTSNIVLSGGSGGCCKGGNGALVMENGKGKKNEKLIIKDDTLVMQNGEADGNLIMDGNNLIFKEGKKDENIIIKGNSGQCCQETVHHHQEEHVPHPIAVHWNAEQTREHRTYVPVPVLHRKNEVHHHHHSKEVHHHNDELGLDSRREDENNRNDTNILTAGETFHTNEQQQREKKSSLKRKIKREQRKMRKLKLGDKLSSKEKEHLKLRRADRRLGRFKLAEKMMDKIRWRKNAKKTNSKDKSKEINKDEQQPTKVDSQDNGEQQYEEEDGEDGNKDQEDEETSSSNLYNGLTGIMYPAVNPSPTGYITPTNFNNMMNLYPPSSVFIPASSLPTTPVSNRRDLRKYEEVKSKNKKIKNLEHVKENIKEDQIETTRHQNSSQETDENDELENNSENNDQENLKLSNNDESKSDQAFKTNESIDSSHKTINHSNIETTTREHNSLRGNHFFQPIFAPDQRQIVSQLTPSLKSLLSLTTNVEQRLALPSHQSPTATLPLFTPTKSPLDSSIALLLPFIARQSYAQQKLIRAQHQKLMVQEAKQQELTKKLQQANAERNERNIRKLFREDYNAKSDYSNDEPEIQDEINENDKHSKPFYFKESENWHKSAENTAKKSQSDLYHDDAEKNDKVSINRLRRRKSELDLNRSKNSKALIRDDEQDQHLSRQAKVRKSNINYDEFNFSDFDDDLTSASEDNFISKRNPQQKFAKRMHTAQKPDLTSEKGISEYNETKANEVRLARNASLILYGY